MKSILILLCLFSLEAYAASFSMRRDREVQSNSLLDIRTDAHEIQKLSPVDDDLVYKFNGIYKVRAAKGQRSRAVLRKFLRYNSEWRADEVEITRPREVDNSEIYDGLFSEGEDVPGWVKKKARKFVSKVKSILRHNRDLNFYYYSSFRDDVFYTYGWLIYNKETRELLAVDVSIDYEL